MEFEKTLNLLNVAPQNLKIIVRCSDTPKLSAYYKQLLDKMVNAEQPQYPVQRRRRPDARGSPNAVGHELPRRNTLFDCRGSQTRNIEPQTECLFIHLTRCRFAHRLIRPDANPSCLGYIQYFNSRLTKDKRGRGCLSVKLFLFNSFIVMLRFGFIRLAQ